MPLMTPFYDTIRDNPDVDITYIVLPNSMHAEYTVRGAQRGKHILCEKPTEVMASLYSTPAARASSRSRRP